MIVRIVTTVSVNNFWFLEGTEYSYYGSYNSETPDCKYDGIEYGALSGKYHKVLIGDVFYDLPDVCVVLLPKESPDPDMRSALQKLYDKRIQDFTAPMFGDHTDVVKSAKKFYGIDIRRKSANNVDVDQSRLRLLEIAKEKLGLTGKRVGINEQTQTVQNENT